MKKKGVATEFNLNLEPSLKRWFQQKFAGPTSVQQAAIREVQSLNSILISSPTGSGKTLAAFLGIFDYLIRQLQAGELGPGVRAIYVSPLRALAYDLQKNITTPLQELGLPEIRVGLRTGDTSSQERAAQRRRPPHILVTTPESLALLLSQEAWLPALKRRRFLVVDEIHALAENKRGTHLAVSAERLEELSPMPLVRIGLSATIAPLAEIGRFLTGPQRTCTIISPRRRKNPASRCSRLSEKIHILLLALLRIGS